MNLLQNLPTLTSAMLRRNVNSLLQLQQTLLATKSSSAQKNKIEECAISLIPEKGKWQNNDNNKEFSEFFFCI